MVTGGASMHPLVEFVLFIVFATLWAWPLVILHELGHAVAALLLTSGRVAVGVGGGRDQLVLTAGRLDFAIAADVAPNGECTFDDGTLRVPKAEAWIAAAGPLVSLCLALVISPVALDDRGLLLASGAFAAWTLTLLTALPLR
jgi:hypothetical protein